MYLFIAINVSSNFISDRGLQRAFSHFFSAIFHTGAESFSFRRAFRSNARLFMFLLARLHKLRLRHPRAVNIPFCLRHAANFHLRILSLAWIFFFQFANEKRESRNKYGEPVLRRARIYLFITQNVRSVSYILHILIQYIAAEKWRTRSCMHSYKKWKKKKINMFINNTLIMQPSFARLYICTRADEYVKTLRINFRKNFRR